MYLRWISLGLFMAFLPALESLAKTPTPQIRFERRSHDFGQVTRGAVLKARFKFHNRGEAPLKIQGVYVACGCTAAEVSPGSEYEEGGTGFIDVTFDTTDFEGKVNKVVTIVTNERVTPDRTLTLSAQVMSEFTVSPPLVDFGDILASQAQPRKVLLSPVGSFALKVKKLEFDRSIIDVTMDRSGKDVALSVGLRADAKAGFLRQQVLLHTNSKSLPILAIPIRGNIQGAVAATPQYLEFGTVRSQQTVSRSMTLSGLSEFNLVGSEVEMVINGTKVSEPERLLVVSPELGPSAKKTLTLALRNHDVGSGSVHGKIHLRALPVAKEDPELVSLDFYAFFR